jgi:hypothetical protein
LFHKSNISECNFLSNKMRQITFRIRVFVPSSSFKFAPCSSSLFNSYLFCITLKISDLALIYKLKLPLIAAITRHLDHIEIAALDFVFWISARLWTVKLEIAPNDEIITVYNSF